MRNEFFELIETELELDAEVVLLEGLELGELLCVDWWFRARITRRSAFGAHELSGEWGWRN